MLLMCMCVFLFHFEESERGLTMSFFVIWEWLQEYSVTARSWILEVLFSPLRLALWNISLSRSPVRYDSFSWRYWNVIVALSRILFNYSWVLVSWWQGRLFESLIFHDGRESSMWFWCTWRLLCIFRHFAARSCHLDIALREELLADRSLDCI